MSRAKKETIPTWMRTEVLERDGNRCRYCGTDDSGRTAFAMDHETSIANLVTACKRCNSKKHAKVGMWPMSPGEMKKLVMLQNKNKELLSDLGEFSAAWGVYKEKEEKNVRIADLLFLIGAIVVGVTPLIQSGSFPFGSEEYHGILFIGVMIYMFAAGVTYANWRMRQ